MIKVDAEFEWVLKATNWSCRDGRYARARRKKNGKTREVYLHRVLWKLKHGTVPKMLDHINEDKLDNRLSNLRPATQPLNKYNITRIRKSSDLPKGVKLHTKRGLKKPYQARIKRHGAERSLGMFATPEEASAAYQEAREVVMEFESLLALDQT